MKRLSGLIGLGCVIGLVPLACVYDSSERCGPNQVGIEDDRCVCADGFVPGETGCVACGENEQSSGAECVCVESYARAGDGAVCEPIPTELGAACDTDTEPCPDGPYPRCQATAGTSGYCTNDCAGSDECDGGYKCHETADGGFCRRPPLGHGKDCQSDEDCADGEATFCETIASRVCLVPCSAGNTAGCFEGEACCDFVVFAPVCVPTDACTSRGGAVLE